MDYKKINDYEQLYLISENDDNSIAIIYEKYKPIVSAIAKKYYSKTNYHCGDLDDFIQEGYIGLDRAIKSFKEGQNVLFYTFSLVCIERQIKGFCRSCFALKNENMINSISIEYEIEDNLKLMDFIPDETPCNNPNYYLDEKIVLDKLIQFKNNLPLRQSLVFELRYNGFKYKEISALLDIPISSVDNCLHICRQKFQKQFVFSSN